MLDFIRNAVNTLAEPFSTAIGFAGNVLGLPPVVTNSIKAVAGAMTGNVMLAAGGALGVVSELQKNPPAQTEFVPSGDAARAQAGYASFVKMTAPSGSTGSPEPRILEYRDALRTIAANYGLLDTLCDKKNEKFDLHTLEMAANHANLSPELRKAARFLLEHPAYRHMLDTAAKGGSVDGTISQKDVQMALKKVNEDIARYGVGQPSTSGPFIPRPTTPAPCSATGSGRPAGGVSDILNDPALSMEEKLQAVLMLITHDTDAELLDVMKEMASVRDQRATLGSGEKDPARASKLETSMEQLNLRLQKLMEKRKQMFDLMSNISSKFNEMAKVAIQNMGRA